MDSTHNQITVRQLVRMPDGAVRTVDAGQALPEGSTRWIDIRCQAPSQLADALSALGYPGSVIGEMAVEKDWYRRRIRLGQMIFAIAAPTRAEKGPVYTPIRVYVTQGEILTVRRAAGDIINHAQADWKNAAGGDARCGAASLLDAVLDAYDPITDGLNERVDALEEQVVSGTVNIRPESFLRLKRRLLILRRHVAWLREMANLLTRDGGAAPGTVERQQMDAVFEHAMRLVDALDMLREVMTGVIDVHMSQVSNRLNINMRVLTVISTVLMTMSLVAAIYGMNFARMPELHWPWGYPAALLVMGALAWIEVAIFRRKGWL